MVMGVPALETTCPHIKLKTKVKHKCELNREKNKTIINLAGMEACDFYQVVYSHVGEKSFHRTVQSCEI